MNKLVVGFVIFTVFAAALAAAGPAFAQAGTYQGQPNRGNGHMNGRGMRAEAQVRMDGSDRQAAHSGILQDEIVAIFAEEFGMPVETLKASLSGGETLAQIATAQGYTADQFRTLMLDARAQAIDQAVAAGELTQAQADWMQTRGPRMDGQVRGAGNGSFANPGCPYAAPASP